LAVDPPEGAIELGERLEPNIVGNLADPPIGIEQLAARFLRPHPRKIIGKFQPGALVEDFAEMKNARARGRRDGGSETFSVLCSSM
jgi:hypothetical protein